MSDYASPGLPRKDPHFYPVLFDVFKVAGNGEPVLIEAEQTLMDATARVIGLQEIFPGDYLIVSRATGEKIFFASTVGAKPN